MRMRDLSMSMFLNTRAMDEARAEAALNEIREICGLLFNGYGEDISSEDNVNLLKKDWVRRFDKYAVNYFNGDKKQAEYCLKDVYNLHKWEKIQQNLHDIDWVTQLVEKKFIDIDTMGAAACVGVNGAEGCLV